MAGAQPFGVDREHPLEQRPFQRWCTRVANPWPFHSVVDNASKQYDFLAWWEKYITARTYCIGSTSFCPYHHCMKSTEKESLETLVDLSHSYGTGSTYVLAGGGNTSWKDKDVLLVKGSGQALGTIQAQGFVRMERSKLASIWTKQYASDSETQEKQVLTDLMDAKSPGQEDKRPSVETLMHDLLPDSYVVHTHPWLVNAMTCAQKGKETFDRLFADRAVWIPLVNPGYVMSRLIKEKLDDFFRKHGSMPKVVFLQNHGLVVAGDSPSDIKALHENILDTLGKELGSRAEPLSIGVPAEEAAKAQAAIARFYASLPDSPLPYTCHHASESCLHHASSTAAFEPLSSAFSPDHIVYMGVAPLRLDSVDELPQAHAAYTKAFGRVPKLILVKNLGAWALGTSPKAAGQAAMLFLDAMRIAQGSQSFGGPLFMEKPFIDFILNWEVEAYRSKVSSGT